jgi:hypothetical protein
MTCHNSGIWMYGNYSEGISGTKYGTLTYIKTSSSLPNITCAVAYWAGCKSTTNERFYQATIAYVAQYGWHFSWGYSQTIFLNHHIRDSHL